MVERVVASWTCTVFIVVHGRAKPARLCMSGPWTTFREIRKVQPAAALSRRPETAAAVAV